MRETMLKIGLAAVAYFSPLYEMFVVLMLFVLVDLITGIVASNRRGVPRSSRRLRKSAVKTVNYILAVVLAYAAERAFRVEWFVAHRAIGAFICAVEFLSILENMALITAHPVFLRLIGWLRGRVSQKSNIITEILNEKNDLSNAAGGPAGGSDRLRRSESRGDRDRPAGDR